MKKMLSVTTAMLLVSASPALAQDAETVVADAQAAAEEAAADAEKLALAEAALDLYWPEGNAQKAADYMLGPWADRMLDSPIRELAEPFQPIMTMFLTEMGGLPGGLGTINEIEVEEEEMEDEAGDDELVIELEQDEGDTSAADAAAGIDFIMALYGDMTMRDIITSEDEHFDERLTIVREVMAEELPGLLVEFEKPMRASLTQVFAKRFTSAELAAIAAFADTPAGEAFAANMLTIGFEPEYFAGIFNSVPGLIEKAPPMAMKLQERMAHLPPMGGLPEDDWTSACEEIEDETEKAECEAEQAASGAAAIENDWEEYKMSAQELDDLAAELEAEAADLRRQAEERRAEEAAEEAQAATE